MQQLAWHCGSVLPCSGRTRWFPALCAAGRTPRLGAGSPEWERLWSRQCSASAAPHLLPATPAGNIAQREKTYMETVSIHWNMYIHGPHTLLEISMWGSGCQISYNTVAPYSFHLRFIKRFIHLISCLSRWNRVPAEKSKHCMHACIT